MMLAAVLLGALALLCLGDLAQAAMPSADGSGCAGWICDELTGCGTAPARPPALPVATLATPVVVAAPTIAVVLSTRVEPPGLPGPQVVPLAPRSPPLG